MLRRLGESQTFISQPVVVDVLSLLVSFVDDGRDWDRMNIYGLAIVIFRFPFLCD